MIKNKITFICEKHKTHFANNIINDLNKIFDIKMVVSNSKIRFLISLLYAEVIWVEWASWPAIIISKYKKPNQKIFVRLHRYEMYRKKYIERIKWDNIDKVIFVNRNLEKEFNNIIPNAKTCTIPNALDMDQFPITERNNDNSLLSYGYQFNPIKGYDKLIELFSKVLDKDSSFTLTIAGKKPDNSLYKEYLEICYKLIKKFDMEKNVNIKLLDISINEIAEHKNINKLLINHNAIISYSLEESFHYALAEGLASGLQGFCNGWRKLNPYQFWAEWCYKDEESFVRSLLNWGELDKNERQKIGSYNRKYIHEHFSSQNITKQYKNLFVKGKI